MDELKAIKRILDQYDEFGTVYDPECVLPPLAARVHGTIEELVIAICELKKQNVAR